MMPSPPSWGWTHVPLASRILISSVLLNVIALTTPFWGWLKTEYYNHASFGLWHFCIGGHCNSIRDNLVQGIDIPVWYHMTQVFYSIGVLCSAIPMFIVASNHQHGKIKLSPTMKQMVVLMLLAGVLQKFTALYTYVSYFDNFNFLYDAIVDIDVYGSFYAAISGACGTLGGAVMLLMDESITKKFKKKKPKVESISEEYSSDFLKMAPVMPQQIKSQQHLLYRGPTYMAPSSGAHYIANKLKTKRITGELEQKRMMKVNKKPCRSLIEDLYLASLKYKKDT